MLSVKRLSLAFLFSALPALVQAQSSPRSSAWPPAVQKVADKSPALSPRKPPRPFTSRRGIGSSWSRASRSCAIRSPSIGIPPAGSGSSRCLPTCATSSCRNPISIPSAGSSCSRTPMATARWTSGRCLPTGSSLPRSVKVPEHGVLVAEPPNVWLMHDRDGDLKMDTKELVDRQVWPAGRRDRRQRQQPLLGDGQQHSTPRRATIYLRFKNGKFEVRKTLAARRMGRDAGRCRPDFPQHQRIRAPRRFRADALLRAQPEPAAHPRQL